MAVNITSPRPSPRLPYIVGYQGHVPEVNTTTKCLGRSFAATAEDTVNKDRVKLQREKKEIYLGINPRGEKFPSYDRSHLYGPEWAIAGYDGHIPRYIQTLGKSFKYTSQEAIDKFQNEHSPRKSKSTRETGSSEMSKSVNDLSGLGVDSQKSLKPGSIYPIIIPRYGGFVPGQKFRFGHSRYYD
ncbi:ciliary microtubule inner protein 2B-like [Symsagittifera roscoffensis]|uniref:ciliary microtubule inner protein 2B-like n=1 Tax=Symsagittifera roscoffensis TaxID=84072 RepID=UPI00307B5C28